MAATRPSNGGRPAVYGKRKKAISVYLPPEWDQQLRVLSEETQTNLSDLALQALSVTYGLKLEPPALVKQPTLPLDTRNSGSSAASAA